MHDKTLQQDKDKKKIGKLIKTELRKGENIG